LIENNTYENNSKINNINYNYYYQKNINFNDNYYEDKKDNISNNRSSKSKDNNTINNKNVSIQKIKLKNIVGSLFKENLELIINEYGIENMEPLRHKYDGISKFGQILYDENRNIINDFQVFTLDNNIESIFTIEYNFIKKKYFFISDINNEEEIHDLNTFIKLEKDFPIKQKLNISLGKANFGLIPLFDNTLEIKLYLENGEKEYYIFDKNKKIIKIGRSKKCDIILKSLEYSRVHTCIYYDEKEKFWYIQDGRKDKNSMNGTWLFINFPWEISYDTKVKIGKNLIELCLI